MTLPASSHSVRWKDYEIATPTFSLSPVEKADMSPFLFHLTGKNEICKILSGEGADIPEDHGFLRASIPESTTGVFDAEVVCFTETPKFALDFFRYRNFKRWQKDQRFGIGFDKSDLVKLGARPCFYPDDPLTDDIVFLHKNINENTFEKNSISDRLLRLIRTIYPLTMPLLENQAAQGFMWEREWRFTNKESGGLVFPHDSIKVICCPKEEEREIINILKGSHEDIKFTQSWKEYSEISAYLKSRENQIYIPKKETVGDEKEFLSVLEEQFEKLQATLKNLEKYREFLEGIEKEKRTTEEELTKLNATVDSLYSQITALKDKLK